MPKEDTKKATRQFWKRCLQVGFCLLILLAICVWICLFHETLPRVSKETTYVTEPLTPDGKRIDYLGALEQEYYDPKMKTDENGYRLIVRALGPLLDGSDSGYDPLFTKQVYEKLGLDPTVKPTLSYEEPYDCLKRYADNLIAQGKTLPPHLANPEESGYKNAEDISFELEDRLRRPWTSEELPMMADWLTQNGPALDLFSKAARKPFFRMPFVWDYQNPSIMNYCYSATQRTRLLARGLSARANYRIARGDIDGAIDDIVSCMTLGRHIGHQGSLVEALVGVALEGIGKAHGIAGSLEHQPTEAQLDRLVAEIENLPPRVTYKKVLHFEHYVVLEMVHLLALNEKRQIEYDEGWDMDPVPLEKIGGRPTAIFGFDWNVVMAQINYCFDNLDELEKIQDGRYNDKEKPWLTPATLLPTSRSKILAGYLVNYVSLFEEIPHPSSEGEAFRRTTCGNNVYKITLAMLRYEKQHGRLPPAYTVDKDGTPLHSWRVLLLPYLGEEAEKLYKKIKLDEPWDSQHNRQFHAAAVDFYQCPSAELPPGETIYSVVVGKKTAFQAGKGKTFKQLGPTSATMILVLESNTSACWMDPGSDLTEKIFTDRKLYDIFRDRPIGYPPHPGVILMGLRDGSIHPISQGTSHEAVQHGLQGTKANWGDD